MSPEPANAKGDNNNNNKNKCDEYVCAQVNDDDDYRPNVAMRWGWSRVTALEGPG